MSISNKDPITFGVALSGESVDRDLLAAQAQVQVAIMQLRTSSYSEIHPIPSCKLTQHMFPFLSDDRYVNVYDAQDLSNQRMLNAVREYTTLPYLSIAFHSSMALRLIRSSVPCV